MSCDCSKAKPIPVCVTNLTIGIGEIDVDYKVVFKTPDGRMDIYSVTSDSTGKIIVEGGEFRLNTTYEVWASLDDYPYIPSNIEDKETIVVDSEDVTCLYLHFTQCFSDSDVTTFATQTITLE